MLIRRVRDRPELPAPDGCILRELLHPQRDAVALPYSIAHARLEPGHETRRHFLRQSEVYHIISGHGRIHVGHETAVVGPGDTILVEPEREQWLENIGETELHFLAIVSPPWNEEDDILLD